MRGVTGGSLPAVMWKEFMTKAGARLADAERARAEKDKPASASDGARQRATCDQRACARRYRSFDADDCTYQPYGRGRRQVCEIAATAEQRFEAAAPPTDDDGQLEVQCNYEMCGRIYSSFRREDCTYQPYDGGARRLCQR